MTHHDADPFTIVCVLHDSEGPFRALLDSLKAQITSRFQLVVVDTGSADAGPGLARTHGAEVMRVDSSVGFGAANNLGLSRARHEVTVLLNPDCELLDSSVATLAAHAGTLPAALHAPRLLNSDGSVQRSAHPLPGTPGSLLPALLPPGLLPRSIRERVEPWRATRSRTVGWVIAACVAAPTATFRQLGPFNEDDFLFFEDLDLCLRARSAGVATVLHPDLRIRHLGGHATSSLYPVEPHELLAERRREVIGRARSHHARRLDDTAQLLTFATRSAARLVTRRPALRERSQLAAQLGVIRRTR